MVLYRWFNGFLIEYCEISGKSCRFVLLYVVIDFKGKYKNFVIWVIVCDSFKCLFYVFW